MTPASTCVQLLLLLSTAICSNIAASSPSVGIIYKSSSSVQFKLYLAAWLGIRDTLPDQDNSMPPPHILDISNAATLQEAAAWLADNGTRRVISLLEPQELVTFLGAYEQLAHNSSEPLLVTLPRQCVHTAAGASFRLTCLQLDSEAVAVALVHRATKVGVTHLLPITLQGDPNRAVDLYRVYKSAVYNNGRPTLKLAPISFDLQRMKTEIKIQNQNRGGGQNATVVFGVLILDREPEALQRVLQTITTVHDPIKLIYTFSPWGVDAMQGQELGLSPYLQELPYVNRLYTVVGAGAKSQWRDPIRMKVLRELDEFIGPHPLILTAMAAYEAAVDIVRQQADIISPVAPRGGVLYGVSPKPGPAILASNGALLQPSGFILEDIVEMEDNRVSGYHVATSSIISRHDLTTLASLAESRINCTRPLLEVTSYDPFNRQPYLHRYSMAAMPQYLLIPNLYGYGLELECVHNEQAPEEFVTNLRIACTPTPDGASVNCYRSNWNHRVKRSQASGRNILSRDDTAMQMPMEAGYYQPYMAMAMADMTTAEPATEPPTSPHPPPSQKPPPPPPDLRQVIKAAKPFMGGCIGSSLGCAMCVLVLGRLSLGASPAVCSGPCFTGVWGQCGALLGRVGSETTIICTELFKQGHIDIQTFMADAEFGAHMQRTDPVTLEGYRVLATPLVHAMRASPKLTQVVATFAVSWASHMRALIGRGNEFPGKGTAEAASKTWGWSGPWIHAIGTPFCTAVGHLASQSARLSALAVGLVPFLGFILAKHRKL